MVLKVVSKLMFLSSLLFFFLRNINKCLKDIGLRTIFRNILLKNNKIINFAKSFLYFIRKYSHNFSNISH